MCVYQATTALAHTVRDALVAAVVDVLLVYLLPIVHLSPSVSAMFPTFFFIVCVPEVKLPDQKEMWSWFSSIHRHGQRSGTCTTMPRDTGPIV